MHWTVKVILALQRRSNRNTRTRKGGLFLTSQEWPFERRGTFDSAGLIHSERAGNEKLPLQEHAGLAAPVLNLSPSWRGERYLRLDRQDREFLPSRSVRPCPLLTSPFPPVGFIPNHIPLHFCTPIRSSVDDGEWSSLGSES